MKLDSLAVTLVRAFALSIVAFLIQDDEHGRHHWEIPSKDPDRIILTFVGDPATSRAVTWRTDDTVPQSIAQIAVATKNSDFAKSATTLKAKLEPFDPGVFKGNAPIKVHYHSVQFKNLKPDTLYAYRVGSGKNDFSEWLHFRTAKPEYAKTQFVYFGDAQNNILSHWSRLIRQAYQTAPNASFAIHAGDLVDVSHKDQQWAEWFKAGGFIHRQWTTIPVVGNHEFRPLADKQPSQLSIHWKPQFTLPVDENLSKDLQETVYTVDYQDIRIVVLNSNRKLDEQSEYLRGQFKDCDAKWKIVTCHHSIFSPAKQRDFEHGRKRWKPILDELGVDLVLNGHDHTYARGHVLIETGEDKQKNLGAVYVTSVSGPKQYSSNKEKIESYKKDNYQADHLDSNTQFFQVITMEGNTLNYEAYNVLGERSDSFRITKDFETCKKSFIKEN